MARSSYPREKPLRPASLSDRVFAADLDTALFREAADLSAARCQQALTKDLYRCYDTRLKTYDACSKRGLKDGSIVDSAGLEACIGTDLRAKVAKACGPQSKLSGDIAARCSGVDLLTAFPACGVMGEPRKRLGGLRLQHHRRGPRGGQVDQ